jgi:hypothetical protein
MEREQQESRQARAVTKPEEDDSQVSLPEPGHEESGTPNAFQVFRTILDRARRSQKPLSSRCELSRDKSKSLFVLVGVSVARPRLD